jgi:hypothetical protein
MRIASVMVGAAISIMSGQPGLAQTFTPGEIVKATVYGEVTDVQVVKQDASGVCVLLKDWQDGTFKPGGANRYLQPSELTRVGGGGAAGGGVTPAQAAQPQDVRGAAAELSGTGPLSKQQILDYLRANVGTGGSHPRKDAVNASVVAAIKKRGVNFKCDWQDLPEFMKVGGMPIVRYAIQDNYGAPVSAQWLIGPWELQFTNATGFYASRESASKKGFVSIEKGNTYIWKIEADDPPEKWIEGKWREATPEEMKYQGGPGIVLLNGEQQWDWIVHKDMTAHSGDWINVADISTRQVIRSGIRKLN